MSDKQQTAVQWFAFELSKLGLLPDGVPDDIYKQAKEIEKQKSINDFVAGNKLEFYDGTEKECAEQYYEQTYGGNNHLCCTPEGQIKRYVNCIGCDRKPLIQGGNK